MKEIVKLITGQNRPKTKIKVKAVVAHWTANEGKGSDAMATGNYFENTDRYASAHMTVDDTELVTSVPWRKGVAEMAYHVGAKVYKTGIQSKLSLYPNDSTIGLEICVNADGDFKKTYVNAVAATAMMLKEHGLNVSNLYRHFDITGKNCPAFFVEDFRAKQFFGKTADKAYADFRADVAKALAPPVIIKPTPVEINKPSAKPKPAPLFRVRKTWADIESQIGSFANIDSAKDLADKNKGFEVYDNDGKIVYTPKPIVTPAPKPVVKPAPKPVAKPAYLGVVTITASALNIRSGPGASYRVTGQTIKGKTFKAYSLKNGWYNIGKDSWVTKEYAVLKKA